MIEDGELTYPGATSFIRFQFENEALHAILVGTIVTLLTFQAIGIVFDLLLGLKQRGKGRLSDISSLLLAEESAVVSVFCNLLPNRKLTTWKFHGFGKPCPCPTRARPLSFLVLFKFLLLLVAAPLLNLGGVVLSLERDRDITFAEANFGGIALGLGDSVPVVRDRLCIPIPTKYARLEFDETTFYKCVFGVRERKPASLDRLPDEAFASLSLRQNSGGSAEALEGEYLKRTESYSFQTQLDISSGGELYRLRSAVTEEMGKSLISRALAQLPHCNPLGPLKSNSSGNGWALNQLMTCANPTSDDLYVLEDITNEVLQIVNADRFEVVSVDRDDGYFLADKLIMARRRRSFLEFVPLCLLAVVMVVVRAIVRVVTNNDLHLGIELAVRGGVGPEGGFRGGEMISHDDIMERVVAGANHEEKL